MGYVILVVIIALGIGAWKFFWWLVESPGEIEDSTDTTPLPPRPSSSRMPRDDDEPRESYKVERLSVDDASDVEDLRAIPSVRLRIRGTFAYVPDSTRHRYGGDEYLLAREPENKYDSNAVAIFGKGRKVGYVPAGRASMIAPLLDEIGAGSYLVSGTGTSPNSIMMWVNIPKVPDLRRYVTNSTKDAYHPSRAGERVSKPSRKNKAARRAAE